MAGEVSGARNEAFFPAEAIAEVRALDVEGREDWAEADWVHELVGAYQRCLRRGAGRQ